MEPRLFTQEELERQLTVRGAAFPPADEYPEDYFPSPPVPAAVLVPLFLEDEEWRILFIRRAEVDGDRHSGQVAFPGGKMDAGDSTSVDAALREAREEIGLERSAVEILGSLGEYRTVSNFVIRGVVGRIEWPLRLQPDPREVSRIFSIPVHWLADRRNLQVSRRRLPDGRTIGSLYRYSPYGGEVLWGVSAMLTVSLIQLLDLMPRGASDSLAEGWARVAPGSGAL